MFYVWLQRQIAWRDPECETVSAFPVYRFLEAMSPLASNNLIAFRFVMRVAVSNSLMWHLKHLSKSSIRLQADFGLAKAIVRMIRLNVWRTSTFSALLTGFWLPISLAVFLLNNVCWNTCLLGFPFLFLSFFFVERGFCSTYFLSMEDLGKVQSVM